MKELFCYVLLFAFAVLPAPAFAQASGESVTPKAFAREGVTQSPFAKCLPAGIKLTNVVEATSVGSAGSHKITVEQKLSDLKATCNNEKKLVDGNGRQIVFYHLIGCWGYPPPNYRELLQKQRREIERLKQSHTVIEMTCNASGVRIP
jgi:hypothetical protein